MVRRATNTSRRTGFSDRQRGAVQGSFQGALPWTLVAGLLVILSIALVVTGIKAGGDGDGDGRQAGEDDVAASAAPTSGNEAENIRASLAGVVDEITEQYNVSAGASMRAGGGVVHVGEVQEAPALSSIKVPVSIAAVQKKLADGQPVEELTDDIENAITVSDNDSALSLWQSLGDEEEAAGALAATLNEAGDTTDTNADRQREDYEGFGDITWNLDNQAIFANRMACLPGHEIPLDAMGRLAEEHSGGLGQLENSHVKGGWGDTAEGDFILREFGLVGPAGAQVPVSVAVIPEDGTEETARQAVADFARRIAPLVDESSANGGAAECQLG